MTKLLLLLLSCTTGGPKPGPTENSPADSAPPAEDTAHEYNPCSDEPYVDVEVGWYSGCALRRDGCLDCWSGPTGAGWTDQGLDEQPEGRWSSVSLADGVDPGPCLDDGDDGPQPELGGCGINSSGELECWGLQPAPSSMPDGTSLEVSVGFRHACALSVDNAASCWGDCSHGECEVPDARFASVLAGQSFSCGLLDTGAVMCWGADTALNCSCAASEECWEARAGAVARWALGPYEEIRASTTKVCGRQGATVTCVDYYDLERPDSGQELAVDLGVAPARMFLVSGIGFLGEICGVTEVGDLACVAVEPVSPPQSEQVPHEGLVDADAGTGLCTVDGGGVLACSFYSEDSAFCPFCDQIWVE